MNGNYERLEQVFEKLGAVQGASHNIATSLAWSFGMSLLGAKAQELRIYEPSDPVYGRRSQKEREDALKAVEGRIERLTEVLNFVGQYIDFESQYAPEGEAIVDAFIGNTPPPAKDESVLELVAETNGMSVADVKKVMTEDEKALSALREHSVNAVKGDYVNAVRSIDRALRAELPIESDLSDEYLARIVERVADKAEQYADRKLTQSLRTRRASRIKGLASERRLLDAVTNYCDELLERLDREAGSTERSPLEEQNAAIVE